MSPLLRRFGRFLKWLVIVLVALVMLVWLGVSIIVKQTVAEDAPFSTVLGMVGAGLWTPVECAVTGCPPELPDGVVFSTFDEALLRATPVAIDVDEWGRLHTVESERQGGFGVEDNRFHPYWLMDDLASRSVEDRRAYQEKWLAAGKFEHPDHFTRRSERLARIEDRDGDGIADFRKELAAWNDPVDGIAAGVETREGVIYATSIPSVYRLRDVDQDGEWEEESVLATGFGVKTSLAGHDLHGLVWGPDGKLYFSMGDRGYRIETSDGRVLAPRMGPGRGAVFRMNPDGSDLEVFATGLRNPQELAFDDHGNLFTGDNNGDGGDSARIVYVVEGGETGWAMPFQSLAGDYVRGPWVAEGLWRPQHEGQPAWVLPPVAEIGNGPAGFAHYPGLGLPDRYADHFFLCDYAYIRGRSGVWSFALEEKGASFELVDRHRFAWSILPTDFDFAWDGRIFVSLFDQIASKQKVMTISHPDSLRNEELEGLAALVQKPMRERDSDALIRLFEHSDQRVRQRAQFELAERGETARLAGKARDRNAALIARLHAVWGAGQIGAEGLRVLAGDDLEWAESEPPEFRAQLARVIGDANATVYAGDMRRWLEDDSPRVRFFAAQAAGALGDRDATEALIGLLRDNADRDVFLRHAAVWALHRIGAVDPLWALRDDPSRSLRMAALLGLRHADDPRLAHFLDDPDPLLVVEAARAIYDLPVDGAMSALAAKIEKIEPALEDDRQTSRALHRRVIGANLRIRTEAGARRLARYAADAKQLLVLRELALASLGDYRDPNPRDLTMGFYRPLPVVPDELLARVFEAEGRALIESDVGARALEIAAGIGVLPLSDRELADLALDSSESDAVRVASLRALGSQGAARGPDAGTATPSDAGPAELAEETARRLLESKAAPVRLAARGLLFEVDAEAGLEAYLAASVSGPDTADRQDAWNRIGLEDDPRVHARLAEGLEEWRAGTGDVGSALDLIRAAASQAGDAALAQAAGELLSNAPGGPVASRGWALAGGDPVAGERVFQTHGDCQRCHGSARGHGAGAGPPLGGIAERGAQHVLESLVVPDAEIAEGFAGEDGRVGGGMPPMGLVLSPVDLRDVIAYVMTLEGPGWLARLGDWFMDQSSEEGES